MPESLRVRDARPNDAATIVEVNARLAGETEHKQLDRATLSAGVDAVLRDRSKGRYFVAESAGNIVGQLMITHEWSDWRNGDIWWIQSVYVMGEQRRGGVFRALYEHARAEAWRCAAVAIRLYVERNNTVAQETYGKLGMKLLPYLVMGESRASEQIDE